MMELFFWHAGKDAFVADEKQFTFREFYNTYIKSNAKHTDENFNTAAQI